LADYSYAIQDARAWKALADRYRFKTVAVLTGALGPFTRILFQDRDWVPVYLDEAGAVFVRNLPDNAETIAQHRLDLTDPASLTFAAPARGRPQWQSGWLTPVADPAPLMSAAYFFLKLGLPGTAEPFLKRALIIDPDNADILAAFVSLELAAERWQEAEHWARLALDHDPRQKSAYFYLGVALNRQQRWAESVEVLGRDLRANPKNFAARLERGEALLRLGKDAEAGADWEAALALEPEQVQLWCKLAELYGRLGNPRAQTAAGHCPGR
jgi:tetratricopeptide (TPR) repeat protein